MRAKEREKKKRRRRRRKEGEKGRGKEGNLASSRTSRNDAATRGARISIFINKHI